MAIGANRDNFVYVDDAANSYIISIAVDRVRGVTPSTGLLVYDPANPPTNFRGRISPKKCRRVYAEGPISAAAGAAVIKRQFICTIGSALYEKDFPQTINYQPEDEAAPLTLTSTGRRGEKFSF